MKMMKMIIIGALLTTSLFAKDVTEKSRLASDMRVMLSAIVDIQRAGFYANKAGVKDATKRLLSSLDSLITTDARKYLPHDQVNAGKFAKKRAKMIKLYAEDLIVSLDILDIDDAIEDYGNILKQCTSCHSRIRNRVWK